jgi:hypothetical protein
LPKRKAIVFASDALLLQVGGAVKGEELGTVRPYRILRDAADEPFAGSEKSVEILASSGIVGAVPDERRGVWRARCSHRCLRATVHEEDPVYRDFAGVPCFDGDRYKMVSPSL